MGEDEVVVEDGVALWVCGSLILIVCGRSWGVRDGLMEEFPTNEAGQPVSESENPVAREGGPERLWATILHLSDLFGLAFPFGNVLAPLVIWLIKRVELPAIDRAGKAVLNFQISWTIYFLVASAMAFAGSCLILPLIFPIVVGILMVIFTIFGAVKASHGESYRHPLALRFFISI